MLACASDCQDVIVSAAAGHDCHVAGEHMEHEHFHYHGCVGHSHGPCGSDDPHSESAEHELIQNQIVHTAMRVALPDAGAQQAWTLLALQLSSEPTDGTAGRAVHDAELDPVPVPQPASVRLLL